MIRLFDTHCHLNDPKFQDDLAAVLEHAASQGVSFVVVPGYDYDSCLRAMELAQTHSMLYAAVGFHPHDAKDVTERYFSELEQWVKDPKVVAIGEIGLDYYYDNSPREVQQQVFRRQIQFAKACRLPIIIHDRDAHGDIVTVLKEEKAEDIGGIMHCFSGSLEMAKECIHMNFYISFGGPVTFKNAKRPREVAAHIPIERLLIETDAPWLTPEPYRGKRNEPAHVRFVAEKISEIRGMTLEQIAEITTANAGRLFAKIVE
ncbi:TatD family hydrolase [Fodinisporobacter ferrooxydans]|uniref:TatD family hydrolase n=1 Tax=Fodinisporobacter ferrooxydans TaxID=2901836 RepID=A0ABY4CMT3_9BACL|nr:TatD family hydrolase [Alicyclobacillaceae bacterium MYW30-H2]